MQFFLYNIQSVVHCRKFR